MVHGDQDDGAEVETQGDAPEPSLLDPDAILGVRVVRDADPAGRAEVVAAEIGGEIVRDQDHAEAAFAARAEAARVEPVVLSDVERAELVARAEAGDDREEAELNASMLIELRQLAEDLATTERIRTDTETHVNEALSRRLSDTTGIAVHPEAIRQAAAAITTAEDEVAQCDDRLAELGHRPDSEEAQLAVGRDTTAAGPAGDNGRQFDPGRSTSALAAAIGVGFTFTAAAVVLLAKHATPVVSALVFVVGIVVALALVRRVRPEDDRALVADDLVEDDSDRRLSESEWLARRAELDTTRERAAERLRSARLRWTSLVGPDADPHDVDALLRVHDPQFELVGAATRVAPAMRTASAVHRRALARWRVAWAAVGYDEPPAVADAEQHLERLAAQADEGASDRARERLTAATAWADACATIDRPIVLLSPGEWLPPGTLAAMVNTLPAGAEVVIVTAQ